MKKFEDFINETSDLHQMNSPAIDGINSNKIRRGGAIPQFGQNIDDNEFVDGDGQGDGTTADGMDGSVAANVSSGSNPIVNGGSANVGGISNTQGNKYPTEEEKDSIMVPAYSYTKKGITGEKFTKVGYAGKIKRFNEI
jgi:hypothetical protein